MDESAVGLWRAVLTDLLVAINGIHGGCAVCLEHFAERSAPVFERHGIPFRYTTNRPGPMTATAVLTEMAVEHLEVIQTEPMAADTEQEHETAPLDGATAVRISSKRRAETAH